MLTEPERIRVLAFEDGSFRYEAMVVDVGREQATKDDEDISYQRCNVLVKCGHLHHLGSDRLQRCCDRVWREHQRELIASRSNS